MADFPLLLNAPSRDWAQHVADLVQRSLDGRGSVHLGIPGDRLPNSPASPGFVVTGIAVCDGPEDVMLGRIAAALVDYHVDTQRLDSGPMQIRIEPAERSYPALATRATAPWATRSAVK